MRQPIICGVVDSERSREAVAVARDLADRLELPLILAHVVDEPADFPFEDPLIMRDEREARAARLLSDIATTLDLPPETELRPESGGPAPMLRTLAAEEDAAMLVVASRGRGRIRSVLFGSVTADLVDGLWCPIMVVAPGAGVRYRRASDAPDATVVCGIDATTPMEILVPRADRLARALGARLLILHADVPPLSSSRGTPAAAGVSIAGAPMVLHERIDRHEEAARSRLERAKQLATEVARLDARAEVGEFAATLTRVAEQPSVQVLVIAQDSPWQRITARVDCPILVTPPGAA